MKISLEDALNTKGIIIDIRDRESYEAGHILKAIFIPSNELIYHYDRYLNFSDNYFLYCEYGSISEDVARRLTILGYHTFSIIGGYHNYLLRG